MIVLWLAHLFLMTCFLSSCDSGHTPMVYQRTLKRPFYMLAWMKANERAGDFTRFLWLPDPTDPESKFEVYRFKTVLFGSTSSPFMLNATWHCHLRNHSSPIAKDTKDNVKVDNIISGCDHHHDYCMFQRTFMGIKQPVASWKGGKG